MSNKINKKVLDKHFFVGYYLLKSKLNRLIIQIVS